MKSIVLDVNVILDLWLNRVPEEDQLIIAGLLADVHTDIYQCWVSSSSMAFVCGSYKGTQAIARAS